MCERVLENVFVRLCACVRAQELGSDRRRGKGVDWGWRGRGAGSAPPSCRVPTTRMQGWVRACASALT